LSEEAETCFVLPLREAVLAHFARRKYEIQPRIWRWMGSSDNDDAHKSIGIAANFGEGGFRPLLGEHAGWCLQQDLGFFTEETSMRRCHKRRKVPRTLLTASLEAFLLS
jgi:hypothetical protein